MTCLSVFWSVGLSVIISIGALVYLLEPFELVPVLLEDKLLDEVPVVVVNLQNDKMYFMHTLHHLHNFVMTQKMRS